jgi:Fic family protein
MARNVNNILTQNYSGQVGKKMILKVRNGKTILAKYNDRSGVKLSLRQQKYNDVFRQAVAYAQEFISDPIRKAELKKKLKSRKKTYDQSPYHAAIQKFMLANHPIGLAEAEKILDQYRELFPLTTRQAMGVKFLIMGEQLSNAVYQNLNKVSKATATRDLQEMVLLGILSATGRGAGAKYLLLDLDSESDQ